MLSSSLKAKGCKAVFHTMQAVNWSNWCYRRFSQTTTEIPWASHCFPFFNIFIDWSSSWHKILFTCFLDRKTMWVTYIVGHSVFIRHFWSSLIILLSIFSQTVMNHSHTSKSIWQTNHFLSIYLKRLYTNFLKLHIRFGYGGGFLIYRSHVNWSSM